MRTLRSLSPADALAALQRALETCGDGVPVYVPACLDETDGVERRPIEALPATPRREALLVGVNTQYALIDRQFGPADVIRVDPRLVELRDAMVVVTIDAGNEEWVALGHSTSQALRAAKAAWDRNATNEGRARTASMPKEFGCPFEEYFGVRYWMLAPGEGEGDEHPIPLPT